MRIMINLLVASLAWAGAIQGQTAYQLESGEMSIAGTSTIHDWVSTVNEMQIEGKFILNGAAPTDIESLQVSIPVKSIISGRGSTMDNKTWKALLSEEHPHILYLLNKVKSIKKTPQGLTLVLDGKVTIAGVEKTIDMEVAGKNLDKDRMEFQGAKKINMTEFGIVPPTAMFGALQTGEEITVSFKVVMKKDEAPK